LTQKPSVSVEAYGHRLILSGHIEELLAILFIRQARGLGSEILKSTDHRN